MDTEINQVANMAAEARKIEAMAAAQAQSLEEVLEGMRQAEVHEVDKPGRVAAIRNMIPGSLFISGTAGTAVPVDAADVNEDPAVHAAFNDVDGDDFYEDDEDDYVEPSIEALTFTFTAVDENNQPTSEPLSAAALSSARQTAAFSCRQQIGPVTMAENIFNEDNSVTVHATVDNEGANLRSLPLFEGTIPFHGQLVRCSAVQTAAEDLPPVAGIYGIG